MIAYTEASCHFEADNNCIGFAQYAYSIYSGNKLMETCVSAPFHGSSVIGEILAVYEAYKKYPEVETIYSDISSGGFKAVLNKMLKHGLEINKLAAKLFLYKGLNQEDARVLYKIVWDLPKWDSTHKARHNKLHNLLWTLGKKTLTDWQHSVNTRRLLLEQAKENFAKERERELLCL